MKLINDLAYPKNFGELDNMMPLNILYNEKNLFQLCHTEVSSEGTFFIGIRILDSDFLKEENNIVIRSCEFIIYTAFTAFSKKDKEEDKINHIYVFDKSKESCISIVNDEKDSEHHGAIFNLQLLIKTEKNDIAFYEDDNLFLEKFHIKFENEITINMSKRLHLKVVLDGLDLSKENSMIIKNRTCQSVFSEKIQYENIK